mmetsp:Transcript_7962/g.11977  ORF Transcript_7962/g.11977 Transcript_7962/m.11977 type:complete len:96 (+) Transcript_7962:96-383(+)
MRIIFGTLHLPTLAKAECLALPTTQFYVAPFAALHQSATKVPSIHIANNFISIIIRYPSSRHLTGWRSFNAPSTLPRQITSQHLQGRNTYILSLK